MLSTGSSAYRFCKTDFPSCFFHQFTCSLIFKFYFHYLLSLLLILLLSLLLLLLLDRLYRAQVQDNFQELVPSFHRVIWAQNSGRQTCTASVFTSRAISRVEKYTFQNLSFLPVHQKSVRTLSPPNIAYVPEISLTKVP